MNVDERMIARDKVCQMTATVRQIPIPVQFRIDIPIAVLGISRDEFARRFGIEFSEFFEDGVGIVHGAGLETPEGTQFCVTTAGGRSSPDSLYLVMEGATHRPYSALNEILRSLDLQGADRVTINHSAVKWARELMQKDGIVPGR